MVHQINGYVPWWLHQRLKQHWVIETWHKAYDKSFNYRSYRKRWPGSSSRFAKTQSWFRDVCCCKRLESGHKTFANSNITPVSFDSENSASFEPALKNIDLLFLLRPPQLSSVSKYVAPFIETAAKASVKHIVFLSVQGVQNSKMIPHHKTEKLIVKSGIPHRFLRPAYFLQNFTTTLQKDLVEINKSICLQARQGLP